MTRCVHWLYMGGGCHKTAVYARRDLHLKMGDAIVFASLEEAVTMFDPTIIMFAGVPVLALVLGIVEAAKSWGLAGKWCTVLALVLGVVFAMLIQLASTFPAFAPWLGALVIGLALGLAASGIYDFANKRWPVQ